MAISDAVAATLRPFTREIVDLCIDEAQNLKFDKRHPQQLYSICTYGSLVELASGIVALAEAKQMICVPILMRTFLDAFAAFRCCIKDPNHFKAMYASFTKEKLRLTEAMIQNPQNKYLARLVVAINAGEEKSRLEKELADIRVQGYRPLKPWEEFQEAELSAEYQSLYWQLCLHAHNNVSTLEDRHLDKKNGDYEVHFFKEETPDDVVRYLDTACGVIIDASMTLHRVLESGRASVFEDLAKKLDGFRKANGYG